jgi:hypothetical protein
MKRLLIVLLLCVLLIGTASATTCAFINITQGAPGPNNDPWYVWINGTRAMTANLSAGGYNISHLLNPVSAQDAATKNYVDITASNITTINSTYATTANLSWTNDTMKSYVDSRPVVNASYETFTNISSYITAVNNSMRTNVSMNFPSTAYVDAVNTSMRTNVSMNFAPLVNGLVPTAKLGSGNGDPTNASKYLRDDQTWQIPATPDYRSVWLSSDFFEAGLTTAIPGLTGLAISSGTAAVLATTANHPGVIYMRDSTTTSGGYKYGCVGTQIIGGNESFEVVFQPVGVRTSQFAQMGWSDTAAAATLPVDGVFFNITGTGAAISLRGNTSSNSARSGTKTSYAPTTATWYRGIIDVNSAANLVTFTIFNAAGVQQWQDTVSTNIPTGASRDTSPCLIVSEISTDAAANILVLDYVRWGTTRPLVR